MSGSLDQAFKWIEEAFEDLRFPGVTKGTFMGRPCLKHRGKTIVGSKDGKALVVHCPLEIKELLLAAGPDLYFDAEHYKGYPAILMRPERTDKATLCIRIEAAWRMNATRSQLMDFESNAE